MPAKPIYCISGLGADHTIFRNLSVNNYELIPVHWVPFNKQDNVCSYAQKVSAQIKEEHPIILGLSFGGMLAVEIAKVRATDKVILVSSAKSRDELGEPPGLLKWVIKSGLLPASFLTIPNKVILDRFGATSGEEQKLISGIMRRSDGHFMKWALKSRLTWNNAVIPKNITHIHGTADKIIPPDNVHPDHWIDGGSHIMVYDRAVEISKIIADTLQ